MNGMSSHSPAGEEAARPSTSVPLDRRARRRFVAFVGWLFERRADEGSLRIALFMVVVSIATGPVTYLASDQASRASELEDRGLQEAVETAFLERSVDAALDHEQRLFTSYRRHEQRDGRRCRPRIRCPV